MQLDEKIVLHSNIPKIIHYCWFGKNEKSDLVIKCIDSWKKKCIGYQIIEWNEENFDININSYVKEAYENKKWAFVSDYVRIMVLYKYGGIYLDTDVEILKSLDTFLDNKLFFGFESIEKISTGIIGAEPNNKFLENILNDYGKRKFIIDNKLDLSTNVDMITNMCKLKGIKLNNLYQIVDGITLYPIEFFSPKDNETGEINVTDNSCAIHYFSGSWLPLKEIEFIKLQNKLCNILNKKMAKRVVYIYSLPYRIRKKIQMEGVKGFKKAIKNRIDRKCKKKRNY